MVVTRQGTPRDQPFEVARLGGDHGLGRRLGKLLSRGGFDVSLCEDRETLREWATGSRPGPECVILDDDVEDPLGVAGGLSRSKPSLPVVFCSADPSSLKAKAVVEAGIDELLTESDLGDFESVRQRLRDLGREYREISTDRRDASIVDTMFERLPVILCAKDNDGRFVRVSSSQTEERKRSAVDRSVASGSSQLAPDEREVLDTGDSIIHRERQDDDGEWHLVSKVPWHDGGELVGVVGLSIDVTDWKQREQELTATSQLLGAIVQTSPAAIVVHDVEGTVQYWNPAAADLFGWSAEEAIREPYPPYVQPEKQAEFESNVETIVESGSIGPLEVRRQTSDGDVLDLQLSAAGVGEGDGEVSRIVTVITDVTVLKERERRLKRQHERLEEFTRVLAHDLRNPIQVLRGQLEAHEQGRTLSETVVDRALDRMETIVDDVVSVAREEPLVTDRARLSLATEAREAWDKLDTPEATLRIECDCTFGGAPHRIQRLFVHLFENAVVHGGTGVTVTVGRTDDGFFVADDGDGIDARHSEQLFEPGYSTEPHATGFGLNVVQEVAQAHDWTVGLCEIEESGTRVEICGVECPES